MSASHPSARICEHGRQLSICAVCAPAADAAYRAAHPSEAEGRTPLSDEQQAMTGAWLLREEAGCVAYCMRCDQRAAWKSDERKAAMYAAADAIERLAARSPASRDAMQETVRPDDQQNVGVDELPACQTSFRVADQQRVVSIAKTDNGRGVTSAGGESGLPHHNPDLWSRVCQSIDHSRVVAMAHTMDDFIGEIQKSEFSAKDVAAARRFLARVEECCDEIPPAAPIVEARDADRESIAQTLWIGFGLHVEKLGFHNDPESAMRAASLIAQYAALLPPETP